jgi:adenosylmethionine-8-amino-7-oxononanoate aminotransferase
MSSDRIQALDARHVWHPFSQAETGPALPVAVKAHGAWVETADGHRVLDLVSSWWVNLHGHGEPKIAAAIARQAATLEQVIFADFTHAPAARLAAALAEALPGDLSKVFYSDNGSTAVEVALKMALQYFPLVGQSQRKRLLGFDQGYHGDTVGAMSVGHSSGYFRAWSGMLFPVDMLPFPATWENDEAVSAKETRALAALDAKLGDDVAAVILEPLIQGAGGMRFCRPDFLRRVADHVRHAGALLILDEVMTGFGRTGTLFACEQAGVVPDLICLSKGLTGGFLPMGATVAREDFCQAFIGQTLDRAFLHGHSYTANPLGCAAGLASLEILTSPDCQARREALAAVQQERVGAVANRRPELHARARGTIAALDLAKGSYGDGSGEKIKAAFWEKGILIRPLGPVVYFLPPFCVTTEEVHKCWDILESELN